LASKGHYVLGVDLNGQKVQMLEQGHAPVLEPGLDELIEKSRAENRLQATQDPARAIHETEVSFVCVGTPNMRNGKLDLSAVERGCEEVGKALRTKKDFHWIVLRSTMLPGTAEKLAIPTIEKGSGKHVGEQFAVCVNPEFTREGCAVSDFLKPEMTVLGAADPKHFVILREIYDWVPGKVFETSLSAAEMVKYVCNIYHALKVSFANEIGTLCSQLGVDTKAVFDIFTSDTKLNISPAYLTPGFAFGGSCLPKDLRALTYRAKEVDLDLPLLHSVMPSNQAHIERAVEAVLHTEKKKVAVLGLSFKAGTDDLRESPLVQLIKRLLGEGCEIQIWDPFVSLGKLTGSNRDFIESIIPHIGSLLREDMKEVVQSAEVVLIGSRVAAREELESCLKQDQIVIDVASISGPTPIRHAMPAQPSGALNSVR
jgi:GDP-mannose 6-dehydrogenase